MSCSYCEQEKKGRKMRRVVLVLLIFGFAGISLAQPIRANIEDAPYIHLNHNVLHFPGGTKKSALYFAKMKALMLKGPGQIQVLHIGGSHIQADIYSNRMRNHLSNFMPHLMSSRGLIFPYTIAKTNNPRNYKVSYNGKWTSVRNVNKSLDNPLGISGISVSTKDTNADIKIQFDVPRETPHEFKRLKVLHNTDSLSFDLRWLSDDSVIISKHSDYTEILFDNYQTEVKIGFHKADSIQNRFELHGLILETERPGFIYNSVGVNGASTWSYLKCEKFGEHVMMLKPDLVFFGIGINDAHDPSFSEQSYFANYEKLMAHFKAANPNVLFVFITNNDSYAYNKKLNTNAEAVRKVMFALAKKHEGAVWDLFNIMGGLTSSTQWRDAGLMAKDRIHFSGEGYNLLGDLLFNALMDSFEDYLTIQAKN
jgi:hypothetical protein